MAQMPRNASQMISGTAEHQSVLPPVEEHPEVREEESGPPIIPNQAMRRGTSPERYTGNMISLFPPKLERGQP